MEWCIALMILGVVIFPWACVRAIIALTYERLLNASSILFVKSRE